MDSDSQLKASVLSSRNRMLLIAGIVLLWATSAILRLAVFGKDGVWALGEDSPFQALIILKAWAATPVSVHHFLPLISLGGAMDKGIPWAGLPADKLGNYYYLSFPALGFFVPYVYHALLGIEPSVRSLLIFNLGIHLLCALLVSALVLRCAHLFPEVGERVVLLGVGLSAFTYLFANEAMFTHGPTYWNHSLFQVAWLTQLVLLLHTLLRQGEDKVAARDWWLVLVCFIAPSVEWTGYLATAAVGSCLFFMACRERSRRLFQLGILAFLAVAFAGIAFLGHFMSVVGFDEGLKHLALRFAARSSSHGSIMAWFRGVFVSFAALPVVGAFAVYSLQRAHRIRPLPTIFVLLCVCAALPIAENILMLEHAVDYSIDRTKIVVSLILFLSGWLFSTPPRVLNFIVGAWLFAVATNVALYLAVPRSIDTSKVGAVERQLWNQLAPYNKPCTVVTSSSVIRGYYNTLTGRGIYEQVPSHRDMQRIVKDRHACLGIWLTSFVAPSGWWDQAYIFDPVRNQTLRQMPNGSLQELTEDMLTTARNVSDVNWRNGIWTASKAGMFVVPDTDEVAGRMAPGNTLTFVKSGARSVVHVGRSTSSSTIAVEVAGGSLDPAGDGYPNQIRYQVWRDLTMQK